MDVTSIKTSTNLYTAQWCHVLHKIFSHNLRSNTALLTRLRGSSSLRFQKLDGARCVSGKDAQNVLLSSEDQAAHEALHRNIPSSSDSALFASENNKRPRPRGTPEETFPFGKKRQRVSRYDVFSMDGSSSTTTGSSASSKTLEGEPSVRSTSSRRPTFKTEISDMDQVVQHKVEEGKVAHKKTEQKSRNELSLLTTELEHCQCTFQIGTFLIFKKLSCKTYSKSIYSPNVFSDSDHISKKYC